MKNCQGLFSKLNIYTHIRTYKTHLSISPVQLQSYVSPANSLYCHRCSVQLHDFPVIPSQNPRGSIYVHSICIHLHPIMRGWLSSGNPAATMGCETASPPITYQSPCAEDRGTTTTADRRFCRSIRSRLSSAFWRCFSFCPSPLSSISRCRVEVWRWDRFLHLCWSSCDYSWVWIRVLLSELRIDWLHFSWCNRNFILSERQLAWDWSRRDRALGGVCVICTKLYQSHIWDMSLCLYLNV